MPKTKIMIFDEAYVIRKGLSTIIGEMDNCEMVGEYESIDQLYSLVKNSHPNYVFISNLLSESIKHEILKKIKNEFHCGFVVITNSLETISNEYFTNSISYNLNKEDLQKKIQNIIDKQGNKLKSENSDHELSEREKDIVTHVAKGLTNKEIADILFISIHTVMTHRKNIVRKLGIKTVSGITVYAILNNLIDMKDLK